MKTKVKGSGVNQNFPRSFTLSVTAFDSRQKNVHKLSVTAQALNSRYRYGSANGGYDLVYQFSVYDMNSGLRREFTLNGEASHHSGLEGSAFTKSFVEAEIKKALRADRSVQIRIAEKEWDRLKIRWDPRY